MVRTFDLAGNQTERLLRSTIRQKQFVIIIDLNTKLREWFLCHGALEYRKAFKKMVKYFNEVSNPLTLGIY